MVTFILPGYSLRNRDWVDECARNLKVGGEIRPVYWDHWTDPEKHLRPKEKAEDLVDIAKGDKINVIAKSVGTLIAAYLVKDIPSQINTVILCGIPSTSDVRLKIFQEAFTGFPSDRIIVYQNDRDPFKRPTEIKDFMLEVNPKVKVIAKPRSDHHYPYYLEFNEFLIKGGV